MNFKTIKKTKKTNNIKEIEYLIKLNKKNIARAFVQEQYNSFRIVDLFVPKEYRHKGYGTAILNEILKDADSKCYKVSGMPASYGDPQYKKELIKYYEKHGFKYIEQIDEIIRKPKCDIT